MCRGLGCFIEYILRVYKKESMYWNCVTCVCYEYRLKLCKEYNEIDLNIKIDIKNY